MVAVTYGTHRIPTAKTAERAKAAAPRKGLFARFMDALVESRLQSVHREISSTRTCCRTRSTNAAFG